MRISPERLIALRLRQPDSSRRSWRRHSICLDCSDSINSHPFLRGRLALKGGTALNLFVFDVPRLSVDIDLNYVDYEGTEDMRRERPMVEEALHAVFSREDYTVRRLPEEHAGGKWSLRYRTAYGDSARIEVDVNYMYRVPLRPLVTMTSRPLGSWKTLEFPQVDCMSSRPGNWPLCSPAREPGTSSTVPSSSHLTPWTWRN